MTQEGADPPTQRIVLQRVRNRIIQYLELASSFDAQREYREGAPVHVPHELINQWADWVSNPLDPVFEEPTFSRLERGAMATFNKVWKQVVASTPDPLPELEVLFRTREWQRLREAAADAVDVFATRGRLSEEREVE